MMNSAKPPEENLPNEQNQTASVVPLGEHWVATTYPDGTVVLMNLSKVPICGTSEVLNLADRDSLNPAAQAVLEGMDPKRIAVRTLLLRTDGAVVTDPDAISPRGELTESAYTVVEPTLSAVNRYFARVSGHDDF